MTEDILSLASSALPESEDNSLLAVFRGEYSLENNLAKQSCELFGPSCLWNTVIPRLMSYFYYKERRTSPALAALPTSPGTAHR